jgi:hypothetical protein
MAGIRRTTVRDLAATGSELQPAQLLRTDLSLDADAFVYLSKVEAADGQPLESKVRRAVNQFVVGCKADGIWTPIKAGCILAGARTLAGALVPLVGTAPTNVNFVSGDYSRKTGLVGNGTSKYLNSNRANNSDPQNSRHISAYLSTGAAGGVTSVLIGAEGAATSGTSLIYNDDAASNGMTFLCASSISTTPASAGASTGTLAGFVGASRSASGSFTGRVGGANTTYTSTSQTPAAQNLAIFARTPTSPARFATCRMVLYTIGEALDLAKLDARATALANAIAAAIP